MNAGCSDAKKRQWKSRPADENFRIALESKLGDERRDAVTRIAESGYVAREDAFQVLSTVARTDAVTQVRCIAIRAFGQYFDNRPIPVLLAILQAAPDSKEALPGNDDVRWDAAVALLILEKKGIATWPQHDAACSLWVKLLQVDTSRNVRMVAAEALGTCQDRKVFAPLIAALRTDDYALADRAENALMVLTGTTQGGDADAWEHWLTTAQDPFANAGHMPPTTRPSGPSWWDKQVRAWRRGLKLRNAD